jgi:elongation factor 1-alpha
MAKEKPIINVAFVGHVDHGKSTTIGHLMFKKGNLPQQKLDKLKAEAEKNGKVGFEFAYYMDRFKEERERGVTIDLSYEKLMTNKYQVTIIDAPGHRDFVKNMITGASQADAAFLVVAAGQGAGVQPQTKEHVWLLRTMGVGEIAVLVNKMDTVEYKEEEYKRIKEDVSNIIKQAGFKPDETAFIPCSGLMGENLADKSDKMSWYSGPTVFDQLDKFKMPEKPTDLPLRMPIQDAYEIKGIGTVPVGKIETGVMKPGQKIIIMPGRTGTGIAGEVKTVEMHHEALPSAEPGDNVGVNLRGIGKKDVARGDVICDANHPMKVVDEFVGQVAVISPLGVIAAGYTPVFHIHTAQVPCKFVEIIEKTAPDGSKVEKPDFLKVGDVAKVRIKPMGNLVLETQADNPHMSRFAIRDAGTTVAAGVCTEVKAKA